MSFLWGQAGAGNAPSQAGPAVGCVAPPVHPRYRSLFPGSTNTFKFDHSFQSPATQTPWTQTEMDAVKEAFRLWTVANTTIPQAFPPTPLNTQFTELTGTGTETIPVRNVFMPPDPITGVIAVGRFNAQVPGNRASWDGYLTAQHSLEILFNTNQAVLSSADGFLKTALHEIGHLMGFDEAYTKLPNGKYQHAPPRATVMNPTGGKDDVGGLQPRDVTSCDQAAARLYAFQPWP
jgi:hypothetical protein